MTRDYLSFRHFLAEHILSKDADLIGPDQTKTAKDNQQNNENNGT
jgi:hypothetical protein